ncbi:MAG: hypothetical protein RIQ93_169 [Verrucomicrobiota bacterium]
MNTPSTSPKPSGSGSRPLVPYLAALCGAMGLAGCASEPVSHVVSAPPPAGPAPVVYASQPAQTVYTTQTNHPTTVAVPSPVGGSSIVVMQAPPAAQQEVPPSRPTRDHVWVPGYWSWQSNAYQWRAGHWETPPRTGAIWVPPRWQMEGGSYRFFEGYWD